MAGTALITGAAGFLGSFVVEEYAARGWTVCGTFHRTPPSADTHSAGVTFRRVDLLDTPAVLELVREARPNVVLHLAAQSSVARSTRDPAGTLMTNILGQHNLLTALVQQESSARVLVVGSADEYGAVRPEENPVTETQELRPATPYAVSKVAQDVMGCQFAAQGLDVVRVRPFIQIGPRRSDTFVTGSFARQIVEIERGLRPPSIEVGNIDLVRDFCDVRDVARACLLAAERGETGAVYNIASGQPRTLRDLLDAMLRASPVEAEIHRHAARVRPGEPEMLVGDPHKFRTRTGWEPLISFEQSACDALQYWRDVL